MKMKLKEVNKSLQEELMCLPFEWFQHVLKDCVNLKEKHVHIVHSIMPYFALNVYYHMCIPIAYSEHSKLLTLSLYYKNGTKIMFEFGENTKHSFTFHGTTKLENWLDILDRIEKSTGKHCVLKIGV